MGSFVALITLVVLALGLVVGVIAYKVSYLFVYCSFEVLNVNSHIWEQA